jgi:hypothetical protein
MGRSSIIHVALSVVLYVILGIPIVVAAVILVFFTPIILPFGMDAPGTSRLAYLFSESIPAIFFVLVVALVVFTAILWHETRWKILAFTIALALCLGTLYLGWTVRLH